MRYAILALILVAATATASSQSREMAAVDGRATCYSISPARLTVAETKDGDWQLRRDGDGMIVGTLSNKEDADAAVAVAVAKRYTTMCVIGRGAKSFRYFESAR